MKNRRGSGSGKKSGLKKENGFLFLSSVIGKGKKSKKKTTRMGCTEFESMIRMKHAMEQVMRIELT